MINNEAKRDSQYLFIDIPGVFEGEQPSTEKPCNDDLFFLNPKHPRILKNGVKIINKLQLLVTKFGYQLAFHSKSKEVDQFQFLDAITSSAKEKNLIFPKVCAAAVFDEFNFYKISPENPEISTDRQYDIQLAGYSVELNGKECVRTALSCLLGISKESRANHIIFDDNKLCCDKAIEEGWQAYLIGNGTTLDQALSSVITKEREKTILKHLSVSMDRNLYTPVFDEALKTERYFQNRLALSQWIGKRYTQDMNSAPFYELKELLVRRIYSLFDVMTPPSDISQQSYLTSTNERIPYTVLMTEVLTNTNPLPNDFLKKYKTSTSKQCFCIKDNLPLDGFGSIYAVAFLLGEVNFHKNLNYTTAQKENTAVIVKATSDKHFLDDIIRNTVVDKQKNFAIHYTQLTQNDMDQMWYTVDLIRNTSDSSIKLIFADIIRLDGHFQKVLDYLLERKSFFFTRLSKEEILENLQKIPVSLERSGEKIQFNIPKTRAWSSNIPREQYIKRIAADLESRMVLNLYGDEGNEKTELAINYINSDFNNYDIVIWVNSYEIIYQQLKIVLEKYLKINCDMFDDSRIMKAFSNATKSKKVLIVLDDWKKSSSITFELFKPHHVLILTLEKVSMPGVSDLQVEGVNEEETYGYLYNHKSVKIRKDEVKNFTRMCNGSLYELFHYASMPDLGAIINNSAVYTKVQQLQLCPKADSVLSFVGYGSCIFTQKQVEIFLNRKIDREINDLLDANIIEKDTESSFFIHKHTQKAIRNVHIYNRKYDNYINKMLFWIYSQINYDESRLDNSSMDIATSLIPHALALCDLLPKDENCKKAKLLHKIGIHLQYHQQNFSKAQECFSKALDLSEGMNELKGMILTNLGNIYGHYGHHDEKIKRLKEALEIKNKIYGALYCSQVAVTLVNIGNAYGETQDYNNQKKHLESAVNIYQNLNTKTRYGHAIALISLGTALGNLQMYDKKLEALQKAEELLKLQLLDGKIIYAKLRENIKSTYAKLNMTRSQIFRK